MPRVQHLRGACVFGQRLGLRRSSHNALDVLHNLVHATGALRTVFDLETDEALVTPVLAPRVLDLEVFVMAISVACTEGFAKHPSLAAARVPPLSDMAFIIVVTVVVVVVTVTVTVTVVVIITIIIIHIIG